MAKTKKEELTGTKAILFADGNANKFQEFKGEELYKEHLQEADYAETKGKVTSKSLSLNTGETNDVVTINGQEVSILVFEDGSVYDVTKGFRSIVSKEVKKAIKSTLTEIEDESEVKSMAAKKESDDKAAALKAENDQKAADKKAAADKLAADKKEAAEKIKAEKEAKKATTTDQTA